MRLDPVIVGSDSKIEDILKYFMGKNTPERQEFIINNLKIEEDLEREHEKQSINNYKKAKLLNFLIYSFLVISVLIPLLVFFVFNNSELAQILINYPIIILFLLIVQIYFFFIRIIFLRN